jgi:predicted nucleotidyltransferase
MLMLENKSSHLLPALKSISLLLNEKDIEGMIIGGLAVSLMGRPRYTNDIDLVILDLDTRLPEFISRLKTLGIEPRIDDIEEFALKSRVLLMRHKESGIDIDISMGVLPFEVEAVGRRHVKNQSGLQLVLPAPEDLIIFKAVAQRPQDIDDIKAIVNRYPDLDKDYILSCVKEFSDILDNIGLYENLINILMPSPGNNP